MAPTPIRNIRVPDELWAKVKERAYNERVDVSAVVNAFLEKYVADKGSNR